MAVNPINVARVSQNLKAFSLLQTVRSNHLGLFRVQNQLATGLRFQAPSEDPSRAAATGRLDRRLDVLKEVSGNLVDVNAFLSEGELAMQDGVSLAVQAHNLALQAANDALTADEREALAVVIDSLTEQMISVGNRQHLGVPLFSGQVGGVAPFEMTSQGVRFNGDGGRLMTTLDTDLSQDFFSISGLEFFQAESRSVQGFVDLDPQITNATRLSDLRGATGNGITLGHILVSDGATTADIDLSGADTLGDVIDLLNEAMPATLQATFNARAIQIQSTGAGPVSITVTDSTGGATAVNLGIFTNTPVPAILGEDLNPRLTPRTVLTDLNAGAGVNLASGFRIRVGTEEAIVDFTGAQTLEDVLNRINQTNIGAFGRISADGAHIEIVNRVSGADMRIEEIGGSAATALGVRSYYSGTLLAGLNDGVGVHSVDGDDIRITTANGTVVDVDVNDVDLAGGTIQDLLNLFNSAGGGAITASLASNGNGLVITDNTAGGGPLTIERLNVSPALDSLGLDVSATGNQLIGRDINPVRVNGPFTALAELKTALHADDGQRVSFAAERLKGALERMQEIQGQLAAKAKVMNERAWRVDSEMTATQVLRSDVRDVDMTDAIVRFQQMQTALQANLTTASKIFDLSLLDYLR